MAISARREKPGLSDTVEMAESIALVAAVRALDGLDPRSYLTGVVPGSRVQGCVVFVSKLDTFVQILVLREV